MQKHVANPSKLTVITCLGVTGLGIGWLIGHFLSSIVLTLPKSVKSFVCLYIITQ